MKRIFKIAITLLILAALFLAVLSALRPKNQQSLLPIKLSVSKTPLSAPLYIALEQGYFKQCGLNVSISEVIGGKRSFMQVVTNQADAGTSSDSVISFGAFKHSNFKSILSFASSNNDVKIIANKNVDLDSSSPIKIGYYPGSASEHLLQMFLELNRLEINAELIELPPEELAKALLAEEIDMMSNWEPYPWKVMFEGNDKYTVLNTKNLSSLHFDLILNDQYVKSHYEAIPRLINALTLAAIFIAEDPTQAREILTEKLAVDPEFIDWVWKDYLFSITPANDLIYSYAANAQWLIEGKMIDTDQPPTFSTYVLADNIEHYRISDARLSKSCNFK